MVMEPRLAETAEQSLIDFASAREIAWPGGGGPLKPTSAPPAPSAHAGHRQRLRTRASISFAALPDYELVELLLARSLPRGNIKPIAKALLARFGGLAGVLGAHIEELKAINGVGPAVALDLKLLHEATARMGRGEVRKRTVI